MSFKFLCLQAATYLFIAYVVLSRLYFKAFVFHLLLYIRTFESVFLLKITLLQWPIKCNYNWQCQTIIVTLAQRNKCHLGNDTSFKTSIDQFLVCICCSLLFQLMTCIILSPGLYECAKFQVIWISGRGEKCISKLHTSKTFVHKSE